MQQTSLIPDMPRTGPNGRDPETGDLLNKFVIAINVTGRSLPSLVYATDWAGVRKFLASNDFKRIAADVEGLTVTNREAS